MKRLLLLFATACAASSTSPDAGTPGVCEWQPPEQTGVLGHADLTEASGLAASRVHDDLFYLHNDSGSAAELFGVRGDGSPAGRWLLDGVHSVDWEDVATGPCPGSGEPCLYVGDVGDNTAARLNVVLHIAPEPKELRSTLLQIVGWVAFTYDDGPRDCEALFVDASGDVFLIEKTASGRARGVWRLSADDVASGGGVATRFATLELPEESDGLVTGADLSPAGDRLVVRTYASVFLYDWPSPGPATLLPDAEAHAGGFEVQGEAVAFTRDGSAILTTSEGRGAPLNRRACER